MGVPVVSKAAQHCSIASEHPSARGAVTIRKWIVRDAAGVGWPPLDSLRCRLGKGSMP